MTRAFRFLLAFVICFVLAPTSDAGWPSSGRVYPRPSGGTCSQATTFLARTSGLSGTQTSAYTALICGMVTDGTWSIMDGLYVFATNSTATANLNLVSTSYGLTQNGTISFLANNGYTGDGSTGYFTTGFTPSTAGGNQTASSASIGVCVLTSRALGAAETALGVYASSYETSITPGVSVDSGTSFYVNAAGYTYSASNAQGSWIGSIHSSTQGYAAHNGTSTSFILTGPALPTSQIYIGALNGGGILPPNYSSDQLAYVFFGGALTPTTITAVYNRLHTYLSTVGAASGC